MKLLTLHIGSHKTATTSVQRWLLANPSMLAEQGIDYPNLRDVVPAAVDFTQWDLIAALAGNPDASRLRADGLTAVLERLATSESEHMILSAENCWGLPVRRHDDYFAAKSEFAARVVSTLREHTQRDLRVVAWVRRPDLYLRSLFNQAVKHRSWSSTADDMPGWFNDFADEHWHLGQYDRHLEVWEGCVGAENVTFRHFAGANAETDPVADFCHVVGIEPRVPLPTERQNESWSAAALEVKHRVNRHVNRPQATRARALIEETMGTEAFGRDLAQALGPGVSRQLQAGYAGDLIRTVERIGRPPSWVQPWGGQELEDPPDTFGQIADLAARLILREVQQDAS